VTSIEPILWDDAAAEPGDAGTHAEGGARMPVEVVPAGGEVAELAERATD
jgi:hypothetical protein